MAAQNFLQALGERHDIERTTQTYSVYQGVRMTDDGPFVRGTTDAAGGMTRGSASCLRTGCSSGTGRLPAVRSAFSMLLAIPATVGASKKLKCDTSTCVASRTRTMSCVAKMESPPNAKKSSSLPQPLNLKHLCPESYQHLFNGRARQESSLLRLVAGCRQEPLGRVVRRDAEAAVYHSGHVVSPPQCRPDVGLSRQPAGSLQSGVGHAPSQGVP